MSGLTFDMLLVLAILLFATILLVIDVLRVDVVAVLVLVTIGITRLLPPEDLFSGFSSEAVISLIAVMVVSSGLEKSGLTYRLARLILQIGRDRPNTISTLLMLCSGVMSSVMRSLGTVAIFLPVASRISSRTGIAKSRLLMPMAFCSILGGTMTMVGTGPLILLNSLLKQANDFTPYEGDIERIQPFGLFDVLPIGLMLLSIGLVYLFFAARHVLPEKETQKNISSTSKKYFQKIYGKGTEIFEIRVPASSSIANGTVRDLELKLPKSLSALAVQYNKELFFPPLRRIIIKPNSYVAIMGTKADVGRFVEKFSLELKPKLNTFSEVLHPARSGLCEAVVPPSSELVGMEVRELHMKRNYKVQVIALLRGNVIYEGEALKNVVLRSGDTLGMYSEWEAMTEFSESPDFVCLTSSFPKEFSRPKKIPHALFFFLLPLILVIFFDFSIAVGFLLGAAGMVASGVLSVDEAYATVSWKTVFLLAGLIPLGIVMQSTGTSQWITESYVAGCQDFHPLTIQIGLAIISTFFALLVSNIGATVLLVPIGINLADYIGADPRLFALTVALAASNTFLLPTHQANALIAGPGSYKARDFLKLGSALTIIYWIVMIVGIDYFFDTY